jgi:hypothetical protein
MMKGSARGLLFFADPSVKRPSNIILLKLNELYPQSTSIRDESHGEDILFGDRIGMSCCALVYLKSE